MSCLSLVDDELNHVADSIASGLNVFTRYLPILDKITTQHDRSTWALGEIFVRHRESATYMYTALLHAGAQLAASSNTVSDRNLRGLDDRTGPSLIPRQEHIQWLRMSAIRAINEDLGDPTILLPQGYSKLASLLAAISTLASYEYDFGDKTLQVLHHRGMAQLIAMVGGIKSLDDLHCRFYDWVLRIALLSKGSPMSSDSSNETDVEGEFKFADGVVACASALRSVLYEPARLLGVTNLDAVLGPED